MFAHTKLAFLGSPLLSSHSRTTFRAMASTQNGSGVAGTSKGHEQADSVLEKAQDFGQKVAGAAGATLDKTKMAPNIEFNTNTLTTNGGTPVANNSFTLRAGPRGPALLQDYAFLEKMGQFNREKTPERVVHARGMVAKGEFEVTNDITEFTCADFLQPGTKTPVAARLSTVTHEKGSPESLRDVRGFAIKFYTKEGNFDMVGNNIPVFFIRDGYQFPDLVHALRPNPKTHIQEGWRILDFLSSKPESSHMLTWLLDDVGIPQDWRHLEGNSVNTYLFINAQGKERYFKMRWLPTEGPKYLTDEEALMVGKDNMRHSHATHDLYNAIDQGNFPEWNFAVQVLDIDGSIEKLGFDPLDDTKEWPESVVPWTPVGKMVLNENIKNFHNEAESIAFDPGLFPPGIAASNDPVLQTRVMAYADTQRYRLGVNYQQLPINQPKCPYHNNMQDGLMQMTARDEEVNYWPSNVQHTKEVESDRYTLTTQHVSGMAVKEDLPPVPGGIGDFRQAGDRIRSMDEGRKGRFTKHLVSWMTEPKCTDVIRQKWYDIWSECDASFGAELKAKVEAAEPSKHAHPLAGATMA